jgi:hypothetical protein
MRERAIASKYCWSYNEEGHEGKPVRKESGWFQSLVEKGVGGKETVSISAPGYGHITYQITRITRTKVFGYMVDDRSEIFTKADVI